MTDYIIRRACSADIDSLFDIEVKSFTTPWSRTAFEAEMQDNDLACYLVVEEAGKVVAYAGMWLIVDEAHITNVAVLTDYRGKGVGQILMQSMIQAAKERGAVSMTLEVRPSNHAALHLYTKLGFVQRGIRRHYYTDNKEDALIMWLDCL
jgi:ribosomal-protein-alanine N-acetyltransferase